MIKLAKAQGASKVKAKKPLVVEIYLNKKKEYCFRVKGGNHYIIAVGESYTRKQGVMKTIKLLMGLNIWVIKDLTLEK